MSTMDLTERPYKRSRENGFLIPKSFSGQINTKGSRVIFHLLLFPPSGNIFRVGSKSTRARDIVLDRCAWNKPSIRNFFCPLHFFVPAHIRNIRPRVACYLHCFCYSDIISCFHIHHPKNCGRTLLLLRKPPKWSRQILCLRHSSELLCVLLSKTPLPARDILRRLGPTSIRDESHRIFFHEARRRSRGNLSSKSTVCVLS